MDNLGIIITDMQEDFLREDRRERRDLIEKHLELLESTKEMNLPLFVLEYIHHENTQAKIKEKLKEQNTKYITKLSDGGFFNYKIDERRVAFLGKYEKENLGHRTEITETGLDYELKQNDILNLIITGLNKYGCVFKTAKEAVEQKYGVIICDELMNEKNLKMDDKDEWYAQNTIRHKTLKELLQNL